MAALQSAGAGVAAVGRRPTRRCPQGDVPQGSVPRSVQARAPQSELAAMSCLLPWGEIRLQRFSLKMLSPVSKMPLSFCHIPSQAWLTASTFCQVLIVQLITRDGGWTQVALGRAR